MINRDICWQNIGLKQTVVTILNLCFHAETKFELFCIVYYLILSYLILFYLILSYLILSYFILFYLILSYFILFYLILNYLKLSYLILAITCFK